MTTHTLLLSMTAFAVISVAHSVPRRPESSGANSDAVQWIPSRLPTSASQAVRLRKVTTFTYIEQRFQPPLIVPTVSSCERA